MKNQDFWHGTIGVALILAFLSFVGGITYLLYGPGITVIIPDFFGTYKSTSTESVSVLVSLSGAGTLFECEGEKALKAEFMEGSVRLALSDDRQLILPQTMSASGARYANTNESFVFWNKGDTAFVEENGVMTYTGCITS